MCGIDLDRPIEYLYSSMRYFDKREHHITRFCDEDVLLLVYEGVLRFTEDGTEYELQPGEYHIQKNHSHQSGERASDAPIYFYTHFKAEWGKSGALLPPDGVFDRAEAKGITDRLDRLSHGDAPLTEKAALFYSLLMMLEKKERPLSLADEMVSYMNSQSLNELSLDKICSDLHFSKNHVINLFKRFFGVTPGKYINGMKLKHAKYLLEVTSDSSESIAVKSGFNDYAHFYRMFCRETGLSPTQWRRRKQMGAIK